MARQKESKLQKIFVWLILLLLLCGCIGVVAHFVGITKDDIKDIFNPTFRVVYGEETYATDTENVLILPTSGQARFDIRNCDGYTVQVLPNVTEETDVTFTIDGVEHRYSDTGDLTAVFLETRNMYGSYFLIDCDNDYTVDSVLSAVWGAEIRLETGIILPYKLIITSTSGETVVIYIQIGNTATGITLPDHIIFYG